MKSIDPQNGTQRAKEKVHIEKESHKAMTILLNPPFKPYPCPDTVFFCLKTDQRQGAIPTELLNPGATPGDYDQQLHNTEIWAKAFQTKHRALPLDESIPSINSPRGKPVE